MNERKRCETCGSQYDIETGCECPISPSTTTVRVTGPNGPFTVPDSLPGHAMAHGKQELRAHSGLGSGALREALQKWQRKYFSAGISHEMWPNAVEHAFEAGWLAALAPSRQEAPTIPTTNRLDRPRQGAGGK